MCVSVLTVLICLKAQWEKLTNAEVGIDTGISCSASQVFVAAERNMLMCSRVTVTFRQTEVN